MADIVFKYDGMRTAVSDIQNISQQFTSAANTFENDFVSSIGQWEGESHDKMVTFINGPVHEYIADTVPKLINALADLLDANITQMEKADQQIAENIPQSLG